MAIPDYQAAITITFDKPITNDPAAVIGTEYYEVMVPYQTSWSLIGTGSPGSAFNGSTGDYWSGGVGGWLGKNFGTPVELACFEYYCGSTSYAPKDCRIEGSADGTNWITVAIVTAPQSDSWIKLEFTPVTYQYWRLYIDSIYSTTPRIYELNLKGRRNVYYTSGWMITGNEYTMAPGGAPFQEIYTLRKVTRSEDHYSVTLWLDLFDRMTHPAGDVTVTYKKIWGNLRGEHNAPLEDFSIVFSPENIIPRFDPHVTDNVSTQINMTMAVYDIIYKYIPAETNTFLVALPASETMKEQVSVGLDMVISVTKVGGLPI